MRVLLDANIYIGYLLGSSGQGAVYAVFGAAFSGRLPLLTADNLLEELTRRVHTKPYLAQRIAPNDLERFTATLLTIAERVPPIAAPLPAVVRDPKDDCLVAYALVGQADYLVTGDRDLLSLGAVGQVRIVRPADFVRELDPREGASR